MTPPSRAGLRKHLLLVVGALSVSVVGGGLGAVAVVMTKPTVSFDIGGFTGAIVSTALAAFLAYHLGLLDHFRRTQSERFLRRYLDEGLVAAADTLNAAVQRALGNWKTATALIGLVEAGIGHESVEYKAMRATLQPVPAGVPPPLLRVAELFDSRELFEALVVTWAELESIDTWATSAVPVTLEAVSGAPTHLRQGLEAMKQECTPVGESLMDIQAFIGVALRKAAEDVENAILSERVADVATLRRSDAMEKVQSSGRQMLTELRSLPFFVRRMKTAPPAPDAVAPAPGESSR